MSRLCRWCGTLGCGILKGAEGCQPLQGPSGVVSTFGPVISVKRMMRQRQWAHLGPWTLESWERGPGLV